MRCLSFLPISFGFNSYKGEETCFFRLLEYSKAAGKGIFCGNKSNDTDDNPIYIKIYIYISEFSKDSHMYNTSPLILILKQPKPVRQATVRKIKRTPLCMILINCFSCWGIFSWVEDILWMMQKGGLSERCHD